MGIAARYWGLGLGILLMKSYNLCLFL
uniref:Uncharacterized protein n=1 Tax=Rhizophora mucronata TaxID=61149 RepID=A0A2P2NEZ8_RHIMU